MLFVEIALALVIAALCGFIAHILRQPTIIGYIAAGLVISSLGVFQLHGAGVFDGFASVGVTLLLFIVGLEMDFRELRHVGVPAILTGIGQILFTFAGGFGLLALLGFSPIVSLYIALALTFSSTIIVVKLLSEKRDLTSHYGRIVVGFLLVQDFVAILALIFLAGLARGGDPGLSFALTLAKGVLLVAAIILGSRLLPRFLDYIGSSPEMLFLFSLAWSLGVAALAASPLVGLSIEIGGFLAGLALAGSSEQFQIGARLKPLRDFFLIIFFVGLGAQMFSQGFSLNLSVSGVLAAFVLIGNPLIVLFIMSLLGYRSKTSFLASLTVAQISEFSFILMAVGARAGHVTSADVSLVTFVGILTIFFSSYFITYGEELYAFFRRPLKFFEAHARRGEETRSGEPLRDHVVLLGVHRLGQTIFRALSEMKAPFIAVDFDPSVVRGFASRGAEVLYGDASDPEIQELARFSSARIVISTIPSFRENLAILDSVRRQNPGARVVLTADTEWMGRELYLLGADYVILPHFLGGEYLAEIIHRDPGLERLAALRERDIGVLAASRVSQARP